jgi:hypothetical protein
MWVPRCLTTLWASKACYKDSFAFFPFTCEEKIKKTNLSVKQKLEFGVYIAHVCGEYGYLNLMYIKQYQALPSPQLVCKIKDIS